MSKTTIPLCRYQYLDGKLVRAAYKEFDPAVEDWRDRLAALNCDLESPIPLGIEGHDALACMIYCGRRADNPYWIAALNFGSFRELVYISSFPDFWQFMNEAGKVLQSVMLTRDRWDMLTAAANHPVE